MNEHDFDGDRPRQLLVCTFGADCSARLKERDGNALALADAVKQARNQAGLNRELYVMKTGCQGWCEHANVVQLLPEGRVYKDMTLAQASSLVQACQKGGAGLEKQLIWDYSKTRQENETRQKAQKGGEK